MLDDLNSWAPLRTQWKVVSLAVLEQRELFRVRGEDEVVHPAVPTVLVHRLGLEEVLRRVSHLHSLVSPVPEVPEAVEPLDWLGLVLGVL